MNKQFDPLNPVFTYNSSIQARMMEMIDSGSRLNIHKKDSVREEKFEDIKEIKSEITSKIKV